MKKVLFILLTAFSLNAFSQCTQPIVLTPLGITVGGGTWQFLMEVHPLADGSNSPVYESWYVNPGSTDTVRIHSCGYPGSLAGINLGATTTPGTWCFGMLAGADFGWCQSCLPHEKWCTKINLDAYYDSIKDNRNNWLCSNVLTAPDPIPGATKSGAKKK